MNIRSRFTESELGFLRQRRCGFATDDREYKKLHAKVTKVARECGLTTRALFTLILINVFDQEALVEFMKNNKPLSCYWHCGYVTTRELKAWALKADSR